MKFCFDDKLIDIDLKKEAYSKWTRGESLRFFGRDYNNAYLEGLEKQAERIRRISDVFIIVGVGGSNGASRAIIESMHKTNNISIVYAGNGLSPFEAERLLEIVDKHEVSINLIAKNFKTLEPGMHFRVLREALIKKYGKNGAAQRIVVTGSENSLLHNLALENNYTFLEFENEIGGRFSAFSNVGLFPMAVAGIDIKSFIEGRNEMLLELKNPEYPLFDYVSYRQKAYREGSSVEIISAESNEFRYFIRWWIQLFGESEGKNGKGLYPDGFCFSEDLHSMGQFIQDGSKIFIETFITVNDYGKKIMFPKSSIRDGFEYLDGMSFNEVNKAMMDASIKAHISSGIPGFVIELDDLSEREFGKLMMFFMAGVYISARIMNVNPFDQNGVEEYKNRMFKVLGSGI